MKRRQPEANDTTNSFCPPGTHATDVTFPAASPLYELLERRRGREQSSRGQESRGGEGGARGGEEKGKSARTSLLNWTMDVLDNGS